MANEKSGSCSAESCRVMHLQTQDPQLILRCNEEESEAILSNLKMEGSLLDEISAEVEA